MCLLFSVVFFFSSRRRHTRYWRDWSSDVCSSDLLVSDSGLAGAPLSEMGLFEVDEASVPKVAREAEIEILAVLNLFRDQLDRYGELAYTGKVIASAFGDLPQSGAVILNADDPLVASL